MTFTQATSPDRLPGGDEEAFVTTNKTVWQRLLANPTAMASIVMLAILTLSAVLAPLLAPGNPLRVSPADRFIPRVPSISSAPTIWAATCSRWCCMAAAPRCSSGWW